MLGEKCQLTGTTRVIGPHTAVRVSLGRLLLGPLCELVA
jgi:hypothetical protein